MEQEQNPQAPAEESVSAEAGSLEAAALAFSKRETSQEEAPEGEAADDAEDTATDEPESEAEEGQAEEDSDTEQDFAEVEVEGITLKVPKDAAQKLKDGVLRQSDYSRKMNELADERKKTAERIERADRLAAAADKLAEAKAGKLLAEYQAQQFAQVDWATLEQEDPAKASLLAVKAMHAQQMLRNADAAIAAAESSVSGVKDAGLAEKRQEMFKSVEEKLKVKWTNEMGADMTKYATEIGVDFGTLSTLTDPGVLIALHKAKQFDELQAKRANLKPVKAVTPVLKPGAPRKTDPKSDALARLRKSNSVDDAAAAFLARMR